MRIVFEGEPAISFGVYGLPGPQGSKRHVGNGQMVESSKKVKPWRAAVDAAARAAQGPGWVPLDGPLVMVVEFYMPRPVAHPKTRRTLPDRIPDLSKLLRATEDALTTAGTYADDARIVQTLMRERYATDNERVSLAHEMTVNGAKIAIYTLDPETTWAEEPWVEVFS